MYVRKRVSVQTEMHYYRREYIALQSNTKGCHKAQSGHKYWQLTLTQTTCEAKRTEAHRRKFRWRPIGPIFRHILVSWAVV